jgi:hypothetical protein
MSNFDTNPIIANLSTGTTIPFRPTTAKNGNVYHAILNPSTGKAAPYGVRVSDAVVGDALPTSIVVNGVTIQGDTTRQEKDDDRPRVRFSGKVDFGDSVGDRMVKLTISRTKDDAAYNVTGRVHRIGGGASKVAVDSL